MTMGFPLYYATAHLKYGWIAVTRSENGITQLSPPSTSREAALTSIQVHPNQTSRDTTGFTNFIEELTLFLDGKIELFSSPIDLADKPPFFRQVWDICRTIPYSETRTYAWLAAATGNQNAYRAVGQAMARNPVPILIPCHRVLKSNGTLGGYAWGTDTKSWLLNIEQFKRNSSVPNKLFAD